MMMGFSFDAEPVVEERIRLNRELMQGGAGRTGKETVFLRRLLLLVGLIR